MSEPKGMLTPKELAKLVQNGEIETVAVVCTDLYGRFVGKRFAARHFLKQILEEGTHACDYLLTVDMEMEPVAGYRYANWERGYGDFHLLPDLQTLRIADWQEKTALVICDVLDPHDHSHVSIAPRSMLKRQIDQARELGYAAQAGSELEYYLFQTSFHEAAAADYRNLDAAGWYIEDYHILQGSREEGFHAPVRRHLEASGIPVECTKGEWGRGQHELNVHYADVLTMADRHVVYKQCLKEVADGMGLSVTFMAKFDAEQAGSSCHVHLSLCEADDSETSAFAGDESFGPVECTDAFRWFLGGWLGHVPEMMVFYAPTVNSYKRYQPGSWAPTRLAWSYDNRTAGFRVVGHAESLRIECRLPGADCNPYLAYAAALASGLDGIRNRIEPPEIYSGDVYAAGELPHVPKTLAEATERFAKSEFAVEALGADVVEHYAHFFRSEQAAYDKAVTDWERKRYFERI